MALSDVLSAITWPTASTGSITPIPSGDPLRAQIEGYITTLYNGSATARGILESLAASGGLNFLQSSGGSQAGTIGGSPFVAFDFAEIASLYYFNDKGRLVLEKPELTVIHELIHLTGPLDPLPPGQFPSDGQIAASFDFDGDTVRMQNTVASELGYSDNIQKNYYSSILSTTGLFGRFDKSVSYSEGRNIDTAVFSDNFGAGDDTLDLTNSYVANSVDILFGLGGNDTLNGGGGSDYLYGGEDDDTFIASSGDDLFHGGGTLKTGGTALALDDDGTDTADYSAAAASEFIKITTDVSGNTFHSGAINAANRMLIQQNSKGTATIVSIEKVVGTDGIDTFEVTQMVADQLAGSDGKGGLAEVDLGSNDKPSLQGDLIDATKMTEKLIIDLGASSGFIQVEGDAEKKVKVLNAERAWGGEKADKITGNDEANELKGGAGDDTVTGGKGDDTIDGGEGDDVAVFSGNCMDYDFIVSGSGSGRTVTVTHARGTMEDGTDTLTGVEWARFSNGELIDLTVEDPGCKGQDIAFVIDTTGSMWDDLAYVQAGAGAVINALFDPARGFTDSRVAVVTFNDPAVDVVLGFTDHEDTNARKAAALAAINSLSADGGGDLPEYTFTGLLTALNGSIGEWREDASSRKIVLFGDATAKDAGLASQVYTLAANVNATVSGASAAMAVDGLSLLTVEMSHTDALTGETSVVPVQIYTVAIGGYFPAIAEYREIAEMTGGIAFQAPSASDLVDALLAVISLPIYNIRFDQSSVVEGDEGTQLVTVTLTRDVTDDASTVTFSSFGTADGSDVTGMPGSIDFAAGQRSVSFTVEVHGDTTSEPDETFGISIDTISENASFTNRTASLTIVDDDAPPTVKVLDQSALDFAGHGNFPFVSYEEGEGPVAVRQVPFKEIVDPDDALPWDIFALDSVDASGEFADFAALTQYGLAVFDGDDKPGNGNNQGIDGDERLVFEVEDDAAFDFATSAMIQLSPTRDGSASGQADFYLDGALVATVLADANGMIDASFDGTGGFDRVEISALGDGLFTVENVSFGDLYAYDMLLV
jgi:Ca2+-binding RTX toxin-like protein